MRTLDGKMALAGGAALLAAVVEGATPHPTPIPEPPVPFGAVIYRAHEVGAIESLGIAVIACRHRDPEPRRFTVQFFHEDGKQVSVFGTYLVPDWPAGPKLTFVSDGRYFRDRENVANVRVGHLTRGTARVISDARVVRCMGRMRFDSGYRHPTVWKGMGFVREGSGEVPEPVDW